LRLITAFHRYYARHSTSGLSSDLSVGFDQVMKDLPRKENRSLGSALQDAVQLGLLFGSYPLACISDGKTFYRLTLLGRETANAVKESE
jgi:hypothetical protein